MDIATILSLIKFAISEEPAVVDALKRIFQKGDPSTADWDAEIASVRSLQYSNLVPNSQLPPDPSQFSDIPPPTKAS